MPILLGLPPGEVCLGSPRPGSKGLPVFYLDEFLDHLQRDGLRPTTIRAYRCVVERLTQWCTRSGIGSAGGVHTMEIHRYLSWLEQSGMSSRERRITVTRLRK